MIRARCHAPENYNLDQGIGFGFSRTSQHAGIAEAGAPYFEGFRLSKPPVIAIVDDDEAVREALFDLLQSEDIAACVFESAVAFLAAETRHCDVVVTDVRMPEMDGLELQRLLAVRGSTLPVIFVSSSTNDETRIRALREGATAWFTKPVPEDELLALLRGLIGRRP